AFAPSPLPPSSNTRSTVFADFENRAVSDLVVNGSVLRNQGLGRFVAAPASVLANAPAGATADFDADGREDAAAIAAGSTLHPLHNDKQTPNAWPPVTLTRPKN